MPKKDKRVTEYINAREPFAGPVLKHLRELVHKASPEIEENIKWGMPSFEYNGMVCSMAAFKKHCTFTFPKAALMKDPDKVLDKVGKTAMGQFGKITSLSDLPADRILIKYIKEAVKLNKGGAKLPVQTKDGKKKKPLDIPGYFTDALKKNKKALKTFEAFSPSHKHEYIEWVTEAKREPTRQKRITTAIEWMSEGKSRNWKYENC